MQGVNLGQSHGCVNGQSQVISAIGLADDTVLGANKLSKLRNILFLTQNYCEKYGVSLCHDKTKLVMLSDGGSTDRELFNPISIDNHSIGFSESAEHVGVIRSREGNMPHIMSRLSAHRKALYATLASGVAQKSRANPMVGLKLEAVYGVPVLMSGIACLVLNEHEITTLDKHLKDTYLNIQKLLQNTPRPVVHFLGGTHSSTHAHFVWYGGAASR